MWICHVSSGARQSAWDLQRVDRARRLCSLSRGSLASLRQSRQKATWPHRELNMRPHMLKKSSTSRRRKNVLLVHCVIGVNYAMFNRSRISQQWSLFEWFETLGWKKKKKQFLTRISFYPLLPFDALSFQKRFTAANRIVSCNCDTFMSNSLFFSHVLSKLFFLLSTCHIELHFGTDFCHFFLTNQLERFHRHCGSELRGVISLRYRHDVELGYFESS